MNKTNLMYIAFVSSALGLASCVKQNQKIDSDKKSMSSVSDTKPQGHWTCAMHPHVHLDASGKCPICGMDLIHVDGVQKKIAENNSVEITVTNKQIVNALISKYTVSKKDFSVSIPVSGRLLSAREIAFQIYESDLSTVKIGMEFSGSAVIYPDIIFTGQISRIDNLVDPSSRTVRAIGVLNKFIPSAIAESGFHGLITQTLKDQIVVPDEAVLRAGTKDLVYVFTTNNQLQAREVILGQKGKMQFQIFSGLKEGEIISSGPNFLIDSEAKLRGQE